MNYQPLIQFVEDRFEEITKRVVTDLFNREETKGYRTLSEEKLREHLQDVYKRLGSWLDPDNYTREEIRKVYTETGRERCLQGIPLQDTLMAFMLIKRHIWLYVNEMKLFDSISETNKSLEFNNSVVLFFDKVLYYTAVGYMNEWCRARQ